MSARLLPAIALVVMSTANVGAGQSDEAALAAFRDVTSVLMSPRCVNCHVPGDAPLQGDDGRLHVMRIKRGPDGRGTSAVRCRTCHQSTNASAQHGPPGSDDWRLPPPGMRMAWHGVSPTALCHGLKEPATNSGRSLEQLVKHVSEDHLVRWGWAPGGGRAVPPISHEAFVAAFATWTQAGAPCPSSEGGAQ
jgi:hypothetical protein